MPHSSAAGDEYCVESGKRNGGGLRTGVAGRRRGFSREWLATAAQPAATAEPMSLQGACTIVRRELDYIAGKKIKKTPCRACVHVGV